MRCSRSRSRGRVRAGFADARGHHTVVLGSGAGVGLLLGLSTVVVTRWGKPWFTLALGAVIGVMYTTWENKYGDLEAFAKAADSVK